MQRLQSQLKNHPLPVLETITGLTFSPFQRAVILSKYPRVCILSPRQSGKSESLVCLALLTMLQGKKVCSFQPSVRQSNGLIDRVRNYLFKMGIVPEICSRSELVLDNGGAIMSKPIKSSSRGDTVDLVIFDEIAFIEESCDDDLLAIALPFLSKPGSRLVVSSTPRGRRGLFYKIWNEQNDFEKILGDVNQVTHYAPDFLQTQREMLGEVLYGREMLCRFDELNEISLFSELDIKKLLGENLCSTTIMEMNGDLKPALSGSISQPDKPRTILHFV